LEGQKNDYNKLYHKIKKNSKGLSPVVASIILIAVTVAVSVVVAAWMGGMTIGLMGNAEQATITNLGFTDSGTALGDTITVSIQNTGDAPVEITQVLLNTNVPSITGATLPVKIEKGALDSTIVISGLTLVPGDEYTVKATTAAGNSLVLTATAP
jgi:archaeal type IV pilus assembly protein PilA